MPVIGEPPPGPKCLIEQGDVLGVDLAVLGRRRNGRCERGRAVGLNLADIALVLALESDNARLREELDDQTP